MRHPSHPRLPGYPSFHCFLGAGQALSLMWQRSEWVGNIWTRRPTGRGFGARAGGWRACHVHQGWGMIQYLREAGLEVLLWHVGRLRMSSCGVELAPTGLARSLFMFCPKGLCLWAVSKSALQVLCSQFSCCWATWPCNAPLPSITCLLIYLHWWKLLN